MGITSLRRHAKARSEAIAPAPAVLSQEDVQATVRKAVAEFASKAEARIERLRTQLTKLDAEGDALRIRGAELEAEAESLKARLADVESAAGGKAELEELLLAARDRIAELEAANQRLAAEAKEAKELAELAMADDATAESDRGDDTPR